ncbi:hypothetical protein MUK42_37103, partial [Musa troglodytarum]
MRRAGTKGRRCGRRRRSRRWCRVEKKRGPPIDEMAGVRREKPALGGAWEQSARAPMSTPIMMFMNTVAMGDIAWNPSQGLTTNEHIKVTSLDSGDGSRSNSDDQEFNLLDKTDEASDSK